MEKKVLIVDDSVFIYEEMKKMLKEMDFEVAGHMKTGEEALDAVESLDPDIITMDIVLPGIDGLEAAQIIKGRWPDKKVLIVSSLAYEETSSLAREAGADGFIFKPFEREDLLKALEALG